MSRLGNGKSLEPRQLDPDLDIEMKTTYEFYHMHIFVLFMWEFFGLFEIVRHAMCSVYVIVNAIFCLRS